VAEAHRLSGAKTFSLDEVSRQPEEIINGKTNCPALLYRLYSKKESPRFLRNFQM